jgi:hypothetical protein
VYGRDRAYGDPALIALAAQAGLPREPPVLPVPGAAALISRLAAVLALSVLLFLNQW